VVSPAAVVRITVDGTLPISPDLVANLQTALDTVETDAIPLVLDLSGAPGPGAAVGLDIGLVTKWERTVRRLERAMALTLAGARGDIGGTALDVLLASDVRVARPGTRLLVARPGAQAWPGTTVYRLVQQAGAGRIREAVLLGSAIEADQAVELGLVHRIGSGPELDELSAAGSGSRGKELAVRRRLLLDATTTPFEEALGAHLAACDRELRRGGPAGAKP
jgi:isomerase DpgB